MFPWTFNFFLGLLWSLPGLLSFSLFGKIPAIRGHRDKEKKVWLFPSSTTVVPFPLPPYSIDATQTLLRGLFLLKDVTEILLQCPNFAAEFQLPIRKQLPVREDHGLGVYHKVVEMGPFQHVGALVLLWMPLYSQQQWETHHPLEGNFGCSCPEAVVKNKILSPNAAAKWCHLAWPPAHTKPLSKLLLHTFF